MKGETSKKVHTRSQDVEVTGSHEKGNYTWELKTATDSDVDANAKDNEKVTNSNHPALTYRNPHKRQKP